MSARKPKRHYRRVDTTSQLKAAYCEVQEALVLSKNDADFNRDQIRHCIREAMGSLSVALHNLNQPE